MPALVVAEVEVSAVAVALVAVEGCFLVAVAGVAPVVEPEQALVLVVVVLAGLHPIRMGGSHFSLPGAEVLRFQ